jgi:ABC-2 type transport system ATP-binding protein
MSIVVNHLSKFYTNQKALDSLSFSIEKGEVVGFLGPNGAGKSTLMKLLTGYLQASEGTAKINGLDCSQQRVLVQKNIGYLPEHNPLYKEMYVREYLQFIAEIHKVPKREITATLQKTGLLSEAHKKIQQLSKGYQQRVGIAAAILHQPDVLILDEPTTGLDPNQLVDIRTLIKEIGKEKTVLFSTHILQEVEAVCNRVLVLHKGKLVADRQLKSLKEGQAQIIEVTFDFQLEKRFFKELSSLKDAVNIGGTSWELTFETQEDQRSEVFDFALKKGLKLLSLTTKNKSLDALFQELTQ